MLSSARHWAPGEPGEFYRRAENGNFAFPIGQTSSLLDRYETSSQMSRRTTPSSDADKPGAAPRKRVPVACERCRKRKIKCSGDEGGICSNCRNVGHTQCQFLRVQSFTADGNHHLRSRYLTCHRFSPYPASSPSRYAYAASSAAYNPYNQSPYPLTQPVEYGSYAGVSPGVPWRSTAPYSPGYSSYDSDNGSPYSSHPPSFMLPNNDPMANSSVYSMSPYSSRSQSGPIWTDQASQFAQAQVSNQIMPSGYAVSTQEQTTGYENFTTGSSASLKPDNGLPYRLNTATPAFGASSYRTLPLPGSRHNSSGSTHDSLPLSAISRSSICFTEASNTSHLSSQTSCGSTQDIGNDRSEAHRGSQDLRFNLLGYSTGPQPTVISGTLPLPVSEAAMQQTSSTGMDQMNSAVQELAQQPRCRAVSQESMQESNIDSGGASASSSYGYTGVTSGRYPQGARSTSGQLSNGAPYTRASQSSHSSFTTGARLDGGVADDSAGAEYSGCQSSSGRASMGSLNNMSTY